MTEELSKTEARGGDRRRMNLTVMLGLPVAFILMAIVAFVIAT